MNERLAIEPNGQVRTHVELLRARASATPSDVAFEFLEGREKSRLSYEELEYRARVLASLLATSVPSGSRALLLFPQGLEFLCAFYGCLYAGVVAVPLASPNRARLEDTLPRLRSIVESCQPNVILSVGDLEELLNGLDFLEANVLPRRRIFVDRELANCGLSDASLSDLSLPKPEDVAFLQYTSGSTAQPKGVVVTHQNLLANHRMQQLSFRHPAGRPIVSWLPLFHDMGLIGNALQAVFLGVSAILMSPMAFLKRPKRWLEAISEYRAFTSGGPNFAYELCARRLTADDCKGLDLSCWEVAFNGSEPVRAETLRSFQELVSRAGFKSTAFLPCYGLAEATLFVSGGGPDQNAVVASVDGAILERTHVVTAPSESQLAGMREIVGCGSVALGSSLAIVDPTSLSLQGDGRVGEIWISGPHVASGYWLHPEATRDTFRAYTNDGIGPYLRTGDLGYSLGGEVYVTGRIKELIIVAGRNIYPQDVEDAARASDERIATATCAAFSVLGNGEERLAIAIEISSVAHDDLTLRRRIRESISLRFGVQVSGMVILRPGTIPKTSSGKLQRRDCGRRFGSAALTEGGLRATP